MARKTRLTAPDPVGPEFVSKTPEHLAVREANVNHLVEQGQENAQALAVQLGYEGSLTVGALEDEIRFYQRRSVEACLELGKRLLILRELAPHGEFSQRVELLGISPRMGQKFMAATFKFAKANSSSLLKAAGTQTKLLELLALDDGEIEALESGESARGITLDEIETMTVSELKAALRDSKEDGAAKDRLLEEKNKKIDALAKDKKKRKVEPWPDEVAGLKEDLAGMGQILDKVLSDHLTVIQATELEIDKLEPEQPAHAGYKTVAHHLAEQIERLCTLAAGLRHEFDTRLGGYIELDKSYILPDAE